MRICSGDRPLNTVGSELSSRTWRKEENNVRAPSGITSSTPVITRESLISRDSDGSGPECSDEARNQVITSIATTLTAAPRPASTTRAGRQVNRLRSSDPSQPNVTWPMVAATRTIATASSDWPSPGSQRGDQPRRDQQADHAADEEADKRQHTDDEALPVAGERERERRDDQDEVEPVHPRPASLGSASGGSGRTCDRSHGCSQPASRSIRSSRPAVKPHTSRPDTSKAAPT